MYIMLSLGIQVGACATRRFKYVEKCVEKYIVNTCPQQFITS